MIDIQRREINILNNKQIEITEIMNKLSSQNNQQIVLKFW